jgi:predicted GIY-YIG superfamily endonuclease
MVSSQARRDQVALAMERGHTQRQACELIELPRAGGPSAGSEALVRVPDSLPQGVIYTGIARNVAVRYAQHVAGTGARYTRANPPSRLLVKFACLNQSEASRMEAAIKKLAATNKRKLVDKTGAVVRKLLFG